MYADTHVHYLPINTDKKNKCKGTLTIGEAILRNQFGVIGNSRSEISTKKRFS